MKVTVEISEKNLKEILKITREKRKGAAIRQLAMEALMLKKRREILDEVEAGKWGLDLPPIVTLRQDREKVSLTPKRLPESGAGKVQLQGFLKSGYPFGTEKQIGQLKTPLACLG